MSVLPNSVPFMTQANSNEHLQEGESFDKFYECWIVEQNQYLQELISFSKEHEEHQRQQGRNGRRTQNLDETTLDVLVVRVVQHYELYYRAKSTWAKNDILSMFSPTWRSTIEDAYLWVGGWRPTMAFDLLYSKSGLQLEARLEEVIRGLLTMTGDLGDLSQSQREMVDELHKETMKEEKEIDEKLAQKQETVADGSMVELTHDVTEMIREGAAELEHVMMDGGLVDLTLAPKVEGLVGILKMADDLRLKTLKKVIDILSPIQGVYFLIAAAELHLRVHEWGMKRDAINNQVPGPGPGQQ